MNIQWYPGHMAKTKRMLSENLGLVDVVIELLDARIPKSSINLDIEPVIRNKRHLIVLGKADLADENVSKRWQIWYKDNGCNSIFINSLNKKSIKAVNIKLKEIMSEKIESDKKRGRIFRPVRTMIVGIPNVGKSTFINTLSGRATAATGDKPGITRGKQWIRINPELQLLDTPGILQPKFEDPDTGLNLAFTGAIKDDIIDLTEIAKLLLEKLMQLYPQELKNRYKLDVTDYTSGYELLEYIGKKRGCLISGGEVDFNRISAIILDEFRGGKIGRISLECPE
jgi:ribosome biogenesis GTPase A